MCRQQFSTQKTRNGCWITEHIRDCQSQNTGGKMLRFFGITFTPQTRPRYNQWNKIFKKGYQREI